MGVKHRLELTRSEVTTVAYKYLDAFRLRVEAIDVDHLGTDPNVFLYQRNTPNPYDGSITDVWIGIASAVDIAEYPVGEPNSLTTYPYYRLNVVEVDLRSVALADALWTHIQKQVNRLLTALTTLETKLVSAESIFLGPVSDSGSDSGSGSGS